MDGIINAYINITAESVCIIFLLILVVAVSVPKRRYITARYISRLAVLNISLLLLQVIQWVGYFGYRGGVGLSRNETVQALVFSLDFALVFWVSFVFFKYMEEHIKSLNQTEDVLSDIPPVLSKALMITGIINQALMLVLSLMGVVFYMDDAGEIHYTWGYIPLFLVGYICMFTCMVLAIKYRKLLGKFDTAVFFIFGIGSMLSFPVTMFFNISISYIIPTIMLYILYLGVGNRRDRELLEEKNIALEREAELEHKNVQIMVSQIQPHFLYNTLSVIDYLCGKDVELARHAVNNFSEYIRTNMESIGSIDPVPFEKELEHTKTYLWIEHMRFSDILKIEYDIRYTDFKIPPLTLQPIVENAVKHGIRGREEGGFVKITTKKEGHDILITVEDDGMGFDTSKEPDMDRIHVGIENVRSRIAAICGGSLLIQSTPGVGTVATIRMGDDIDENFAG